MEMSCSVGPESLSVNHDLASKRVAKVFCLAETASHFE